MANLWTGTVKSSDAYVTLASVSELTFTEGSKYVIQIQNPAWIREGEDGAGFYVFNDEPFEYTAGSDDLYIKTVTQCIVNIAEGEQASE